MPRRLRYSGLALISIASIANAPTAGFYAQGAQPIWADIAGSSKPLRLVSPDRASHAIFRYSDKNDGEVSLRVSGRMGAGSVSLGPGVGSELLWAPNSEAFAVTTSDGGANGPYRSIIVMGGGNGLRVHDLTAMIAGAFGHPTKCGWRESPNIGIIKWQNGSAKVIVAAEIVAHSNCDSFGTFRAYEVDTRTLRITASFDQIEAKRRFGAHLGIELRAAPDECVRTPRRCWVSTNH